MRKSFIFIILLSILSISTIGQLAYYWNQYRIADSLVSLFAEPPKLTEEDRLILEQTVHRRDEARGFAYAAGFELILLGSMCWVFFLSKKEKVGTREATKHEGSCGLGQGTPETS